MIDRRMLMQGSAAAMLAAGGLTQAVPARAQTLTDVRIGFAVPDVSNLLVYVAADKGLFAAEGLQVQQIQFQSDFAAVEGITAGAVDIVCGSIAAVLSSYATGRDFEAFWSVSNLPGYIWYGPAKYKSLRDLKGHGKIGISSYNSQTHLLSEWAVAQIGLNPTKDVTYIAIGGPGQRVAALRAGQVDAIPATPPGMFILEQEGFKPLLTLKSILPQYEYETYYARKGYLAKNPDVVRKVLTASIKAIRWCKANPDQATSILMKYLEAKPSERAIYRRTIDFAVPYFPEDGHFADQSIDVLLQFDKALGQIKTMPKSHAAFTDYSFIDYFKSHPVT
jgi:NitT/TauT family transport system substrate-binding protein